MIAANITFTPTTNLTTNVEIAHIITWAVPDDGSPTLEAMEMNLGTSLLFMGTEEETSLLLAPFASYISCMESDFSEELVAPVANMTYVWTPTEAGQFWFVGLSCSDGQRLQVDVADPNAVPVAFSPQTIPSGTLTLRAPLLLLSLALPVALAP
uniref:Uncharacterized protein n=1 Tax=Eutreptiella gymnastica TaxID=73025 RepID=A0A7S1J466_9EUGL